jgi:hypothetical protein
VTTRILNFLKSPVESAKRRSLGLELLETLLRSGTLLTANGNERRPLTRFRPELFFEVWRKLGYATTLEGTRIELSQNESLVTMSSMSSRLREPKA